MSTSTDPIVKINEAMDAAIEAQEAGDFSTAERKARTAWMVIAALPDSELCDERLRWKPDSVRLIVQDLARRASTTRQDSDGYGTLIQPVEITYKRG